MAIAHFLERTLQRAVAPFPASVRAVLRGMFYALDRRPADTMRYHHEHSGDQIGGLLDLIDYVRELGLNGVGLEVGCHAGESTEMFAKHFHTFHAVDPWSHMGRVERAFDHRLAPYPHVQKWKMTSREAAAHFDDASLDFVYLDADHNYEFVREDILLWMPKIRKGGLLAGHDYCAQEHDVMKAVDELVGAPDRIFRDSSWVKRVA